MKKHLILISTILISILCNSNLFAYWCNDSGASMTFKSYDKFYNQFRNLEDFYEDSFCGDSYKFKDHDHTCKDYSNVKKSINKFQSKLVDLGFNGISAKSDMKNLHDNCKKAKYKYKADDGRTPYQIYKQIRNAIEFIESEDGFKAQSNKCLERINKLKADACKKEDNKKNEWLIGRFKHYLEYPDSILFCESYGDKSFYQFSLTRGEIDPKEIDVKFIEFIQTQGDNFESKNIVTLDNHKNFNFSYSNHDGFPRYSFRSNQSILNNVTLKAINFAKGQYSAPYDFMYQMDGIINGEKRSFMCVDMVEERALYGNPDGF